MTVDFGGNRNSTYTTLIVGDFNRAVAAAGIYVIPVGIFRVRFGFFGACHPEHTGIDFFDLCIFCHCIANLFKGYAFGCLRVIKRTTCDGTYSTFVIKVVECSACDGCNGTLVAQTDLAALCTDGCIGNEIDHAAALDIDGHVSRIGHNDAVCKGHMAFVDNDCRVVFVAHRSAGALECQVKVVRIQRHEIPVGNGPHKAAELRIQLFVQASVITVGNIPFTAVVHAAVHPSIGGSHGVFTKHCVKHIARVFIT